MTVSTRLVAALVPTVGATVGSRVGATFCPGFGAKVNSATTSLVERLSARFGPGLDGGLPKIAVLLQVR